MKFRNRQKETVVLKIFMIVTYEEEEMGKVLLLYWDGCL